MSVKCEGEVMYDGIKSHLRGVQQACRREARNIRRQEQGDERDEARSRGVRAARTRKDKNRRFPRAIG
jgi:hypothetical protein